MYKYLYKIFKGEFPEETKKREAVGDALLNLISVMTKAKEEPCKNMVEYPLISSEDQGATKILSVLKSIKESVSQEHINYRKIQENLEKQVNDQIFIQYLNEGGLPACGMVPPYNWRFSESENQLISSDKLKFGGQEGGLIARIRSNGTGISDYNDPLLIDVWNEVYNAILRESEFNPFAFDFTARLLTMFKIDTDSS